MGESHSRGWLGLATDRVALCAHTRLTLAQLVLERAGSWRRAWAFGSNGPKPFLCRPEGEGERGRERESLSLSLVVRRNTEHTGKGTQRRTGETPSMELTAPVSRVARSVSVPLSFLSLFRGENSPEAVLAVLPVLSSVQQPAAFIPCYLSRTDRTHCRRLKQLDATKKAAGRHTRAQTRETAHRRHGLQYAAEKWLFNLPNETRHAAQALRALTATLYLSLSPSLPVAEKAWATPSETILSAGNEFSLPLSPPRQVAHCVGSVLNVLSLCHAARESPARAPALRSIKLNV